MSHLTFAEATVVGLIQGVTELFPVSSLGHNVLIPALVGGSWARDLNVSKPESPYLAFIVGLHVATALAMIIYFWRDWLRIITGFLTSLRDRRVATADQRLAWLIILATIPVGIAGLALEHLFRVVFSKPVPTALFLAANGVVLLVGEYRRRRGGAARGEQDGAEDESREVGTEQAIAADQRLATMGIGKAVLIGASQIFALLPGISRDGIVTVTGMFRGISRQDAVRFSFLLSAPVILAAGALKIPDLTGPLGAGIGGQILAGSLLSFVGAYLSVRFLTRYFAKARSLIPFGVYCLAAGLISVAYLLLR
ncbi:MAG: undecaprenyl-diphosphate phosphatase [Nocardiopsaceae bacterium]|nr:undecaprenyl-diphosphate phosphatase [Nocardiopsaceae bacterium]